jgi:hypothetical protein
MLLHAEHWDGQRIYNFKGADMPNIRKLLTYSWLNHEENDIEWKRELGLE